MEVIKVGETILPSGQRVKRLALFSQPRESQPFKLLVADDGSTIYARQYPHLDTQRPDEWDEVGPYTGSPASADALYGFDRQDLTEFVKDA